MDHSIAARFSRNEEKVCTVTGQFAKAIELVFIINYGEVHNASLRRKQIGRIKRGGRLRK